MLIDRAEAERRFGRLTTDNAVVSFLEFETPEGRWVPRYGGEFGIAECVGYELKGAFPQTSPV